MPHLRNTFIFLILAAMFSCGGGTRHGEMLRQLERAEEMNSSYTPMDTLRGVEEMTEYFMAHGSEEERIRANYMMGSVFRDRGDSPMALEYYLKAINQTDTTKADCNHELLSRIYGQMGQIYINQRHAPKILEMYSLAADHALKADDTLAYIFFFKRTAAAYRIVNNHEKSQQIQKEAYRKFKEMGEDRFAAAMSMNFASYYLHKDSPEMAKPFIDEYASSSGFVDKDGTPKQGKELFYFYLGLYYEKTNRLDSALHFYRRAQNSSDLSSVENANKGLMTVYQKLHQCDSVVKYATLYADANDTANVRNSADEVSRVQSLYDYTAHKQRALEKTEENHALWRIIFIAVIAAAAVALVTLRIFRRQRARSIEEIRLANTRYTETIRQLREAQESYRQLTADRSQYEAALQRQIEQLQNSLSGYEEIFATSPDEQSLLSNFFVMQFHQYAAQIKLPAADDWAKLEDLVSKSLPDFWLTLAAASLTEKERRLSLLTRLNFITSEIAILLEISRQRVSNLRSSLNAKLFHESGATTFTANLFRL